MDGPSLLSLMRQRRATRHFLPDAVPPEIVTTILEAARSAPSGFNLQPIHIVIVTDASQKQALRLACMNQSQLTEAHTILVCVGDRLAAKHHLNDVLAADRAAGYTNAAYDAIVRRYCWAGFRTAPAGLGGLLKRWLLPVVRLVTPVPDLPVEDPVGWLRKQSAFSAMQAMLMAEALGYHTCPMEGFDTRRVARILGLPRHVVPTLVVPLGRAQPQPHAGRTRLPLSRLTHHDRWQQPYPPAP
jgi:nitroreductase